jgi:hypothetical protein
MSGTRADHLIEREGELTINKDSGALIAGAGAGTC